MAGMSEAELCRWLGRRVSIRVTGGEALCGRLQHVSTRNAFLVEDSRSSEPFSATVRQVPLARIDRVSPASGDATVA